MKKTTIKTIGCIMICAAFSVSGKSQGAKGENPMQVTVAKVAAGLVQTAQAQFRSGRDSAGAETCMQLYDLDNEANREWLVKAGDGYYRAGLYARAKAVFVRYLDKRSTTAVAAKLAAVEFSLRNHSRVIELLKPIPDLVASQDGLTMIAAESYFATGAYDEVLSLLPASKLNKNRRGLELAGMSSEKMGDYRTALTCCEKLLTMTTAGKRQEYSCRIAILYEEMGQKNRAIKAYEKNISESPADLRSLERVSRLYMSECQWRSAQVMLEKALMLPEARPVLKRMLGQCLAAQANRVAAVNQYRQYLAKVPNDSAAWCELGLVCYEQEHYAEAVEVLSKSAAMMPKNAECLTLLGESLVKNGNSREAVAPLERSRAIVKNDIRVLCRLAECYRVLHDKKNLMSVVKDWAAFDPKNTQALFELAQMHMDNQKWRDAMSVLENACAIDSANAQVHLLYAKACEKINNENGRFSHLRKAFRYAPESADVLYELGAVYSSKGQVAAARPLLTKALSIDRMHAGAHFEYAKLLKSVNEKDSAYEHFSTAAQIDPFNNAYLVQFAQSAYALGKRGIAFDYIKKALSRDSTQFEVLQWAGIMYKEAGSIDTAKALLLKAIVRGTKCASCYKHLAEIYFDDGVYDLAVKFYTQSLSVGSYSEAASKGLGNALILSGDFERARQMYEKIFNDNPRSEEALYRLVSVNLREGTFDKAKSLFEQYNAGRKGGWTHLTRGEIAEYEGRAEEALISFSVASTLMPENPLAHAGLGRINLMKKEYDKAVENFGRALGNAPHNVDFLLGMGQAYEGIGQFPSAFELYAEVARKAPRQPDVFGLMGWVLSRQQLHEQAVAAFKRGLELNPKNGALAYGLGRELRVTLQFDEAIAALKKSVKSRNDEKRFFSAYKDIGDIYFYDLKNPDKAKDWYKKYIKSGGKDETVVSLVNEMKS